MKCRYEKSKAGVLPKIVIQFFAQPLTEQPPHFYLLLFEFKGIPDFAKSAQDYHAVSGHFGLLGDLHHTVEAAQQVLLQDQVLPDF